MSAKTNVSNIEPLRKPVKCPSCKNNSQRDFYPFCSRRCSDTDLHKWFSQGYAIPAEDVDVEAHRHYEE